MRTTAGWASVALLAWGTLGCGDDRPPAADPTTPFVRPRIERIVTGVSVEAADAYLEEGARLPDEGAPALSAQGLPTGITGGSNAYALSADVPFDVVLVGVSGVEGRWRTDLPEASDGVEVVVSFAQDAREGDVEVTFQVLDADDRASNFAVVPVRLLRVGTGELQISLSWDTATDVDLHVVEPSGEEIFYGLTESTSGGLLDLDSNAGCALDDVNNENVTWPSTPPAGEYVVRVDYWSACDEASTTSYVVTVRRGTSTPATFRGSFEAADETMGGLGDGVEVTRFAY